MPAKCVHGVADIRLSQIVNYTIHSVIDDHSNRPLFSNSTPFDPKAIPRIDSSDYPEQIKPVAVLDRDYLSSIGFAGRASQ